MELYEYIRSFLQDSVGSFLSTVPPVYFLLTIGLSSVFIKKANNDTINSIIVSVSALIMGFLACYAYPDEFATPHGIVSLVAGWVSALLVVRYRKWIFGFLKRKSGTKTV